MDASQANRTLRLSLPELETACAASARGLREPGAGVTPFFHLPSGAILYAADSNPEGQTAEDLFCDPAYRTLPTDIGNIEAQEVAAFLATLSGAERQALPADLPGGCGACQRLDDHLEAGGDAALRESWRTYQTARRRERIEAWLRGQGIEPEWIGQAATGAQSR